MAWKAPGNAAMERCVDSRDEEVRTDSKRRSNLSHGQSRARSHRKDHSVSRSDARVDRCGLPYFVNIGGREVDPAMQGYRHRPPAIRRPTKKFRRAESRAAVWNPRERARRLIEEMRSQSDGFSTDDRRRLAHELCMLRLECEYLLLRLSNLKAAEALLVEFRQAVENLLEASE